MYVFRALLALSFDGMLRWYLVHCQDSLLMDCHVSISRTSRILTFVRPRLKMKNTKTPRTGEGLHNSQQFVHHFAHQD